MSPLPSESDPEFHLSDRASASEPNMLIRVLIMRLVIGVNKDR